MIKPVLSILLSFLAISAFCKNDYPLTIVENKGQVTDQSFHPRGDIDFRIGAPGMSLFIGQGKLLYQFYSVERMPEPLSAGITRTKKMPEPFKVEGYRMDVELIGANTNAKILTGNEQDYYENYYNENFPDGVTAHTYGSVTYKDVYPNIDWVIYLKDGKVEQDFIVRAGGKPTDIKVKYSGATSLAIDNDGSLRAQTPMGSVIEAAPLVYEANGGRRVASRYVLRDNVLTLDVAQYNGELVLDPTLVWGTYYGGEGNDNVGDMANDNAGNLYVTGSTQSMLNIATNGTFGSSYFGSGDGFIMKFNSGGGRIWGSFYGGNTGYDDGDAIVIDDAGYLFVVGQTNSINGMATPGVFQTVLGSTTWDAYLTKFTPAGNRVWGTYIGGTGTEWSCDVAVDNKGHVYVMGVTDNATGLATVGAHQMTNGGGTYDNFLTRFDTSGHIDWYTYYGGLQDENNGAITCDTLDGVYMVGQTASTNAIATPGTHQPTYGGGSFVLDAYIVKFDSLGVRQWGTYYGGNQQDAAMDVVIDDNLDLYITGSGGSVGIVTSGTYQTTFGGGPCDGFIAKFNNIGQRLWATYYGGIDNDYITGVKLDDNKNLVMAGFTQSGNFSTTTGAYQTLFGGGQNDGFVLRFDTMGNRIYASYYGGNDRDEIYGISTHNNDIYLGGSTGSMTGIATLGCHQPQKYNQQYDGWVGKFSNCTPPAQPTITGDTSLCYYGIGVYHIAPTTGVLSYNWSAPYGWTGQVQGDSLTLYSTLVSGNVVVSIVNSCANSIPDTFQVSLYGPPAPVITQSGNVLQTTTTFTGYQWYLNGVLITGATSQSHTAVQDGNYYVIVTANGCSDTSNTIGISGTGMEHMVANGGVSVYPNPFSSSFNILGQFAAEQTDVSYDVLDVTGRSIQAGNVKVENGVVKDVITLDGLASGMYLLRLMSEKQMLLVPLILNRN
ncbi:MAG: T9SS type A sorting domain-containing protein [Flavipsychrobacter sp.]|nr:T9SS type A sorting domain-containing protein [Flavipsychrobacter sp.]